MTRPGYTAVPGCREQRQQPSGVTAAISRIPCSLTSLRQTPHAVSSHPGNSAIATRADQADRDAANDALAQSASSS